MIELTPTMRWDEESKRLIVEKDGKKFEWDEDSLAYLSYAMPVGQFFFIKKRDGDKNMLTITKAYPKDEAEAHSLRKSSMCEGLQAEYDKEHGL